MLSTKLICASTVFPAFVTTYLMVTSKLPSIPLDASTTSAIDLATPILGNRRGVGSSNPPSPLSVVASIPLSESSVTGSTRFPSTPINGSPLISRGSPEVVP